MNGTQTELPLPGVANPHPEDAGWGWRKLIFFVFLAFMAHVALVYSFGTKKMPMPRTVNNVPQLQLAGRADELVELENPALLALPNPRDFASSVWLKTPEITPPAFRWSEAPRWLPLAGKDLGAVFNQFMQTNAFAETPLTFKPAPQFMLSASAIASALPASSTLQISRNLAGRELLYQPALPSLPYNDVIAPTRVLILVDAAGNVVSAILLPPGNSLESSGHSADADNKALILARTLRFKTAKQITLGEVIFYWRTIPLTSTNAP
jgi:hypothetical protein